MSKALFTLAVDDYAPEIRAITEPFMRHWADKIGAEFHVIKERRFPGWPAVYEKLQLRELAAAGGYEWTMFLDADTLIFPDSPDWTALVPEGHVCCYGWDWAPVRFSMDEYFRRDGRMIGWAGWCTIVHGWCRDFWRPAAESLEELLPRMHPTVSEAQMGMGAEHMVDDYVVSRNVARFGLKAVTLSGIMGRYEQQGNWFWHRYDIPTKDKASYMKTVLQGGEVLDSATGEQKKLPGWRVPVKMLRGGPWGGGWVPASST